MSTTVSYNGSTIATVENETVTLETAETWMGDDLTLVDETDTVVHTTVTLDNGNYGSCTLEFSAAAEPKYVVATANFTGHFAYTNLRPVDAFVYDGTYCYRLIAGLYASNVPEITRTIYTQITKSSVTEYGFTYSSGTVTLRADHSDYEGTSTAHYAFMDGEWMITYIY